MKNMGQMPRGLVVILKTMSPLLPALKILNDSNVWSVREMANEMGRQFNLSDDEMKTLLPSGTQTVIANRTNWSLYYLMRAGLLQNAKRGYYKITDRGKNVLKEKLKFIDSNYLMKFNEFRDFKVKRNDQETGKPDNDDTQDEIDTPEEILENAFLKIKGNLSIEVLEKVYQQTPDFFEKLVIELLIKMGYGGSVKEAGRAIGKTNDEGIDGVIKEDKLGLDVIYVQAKRWDPTVVIGRPEIQ